MELKDLTNEELLELYKIIDDFIKNLDSTKAGL